MKKENKEFQFSRIVDARYQHCGASWKPRQQTSHTFKITVPRWSNVANPYMGRTFTSVGELSLRDLKKQFEFNVVFSVVATLYLVFFNGWLLHTCVKR